MPEPTTRDGHVARAQELAEAAYAYHVDLKNAAKILQDPERMISAQRVAELNQMAAASVARMHALAAMATAHAQIAEVLRQQPAPPTSRWIQHHPKYFQQGPWALVFLDVDELRDDQEEMGWYLYGPGLGKSGYWTCPGLGGAQALADRVIDSYHANPGSKKADS